MRDSTYIWWAVAIAAAVVIGAVTARDAQLAVALALVVIAGFSVAIPVPYWVAAATTAAIICPGLQAIGLLPGFGAYLHFPLAVGAFAIALATAGRLTKQAAWSCVAILALALVVGISAGLAGDPPLRALFSLALLVEPLALIAALCLRPPNDVEWRFVRRAWFGLAILQLPVLAVQFVTIGPASVLTTSAADGMRGTIGLQGGAHLVAGVAVLAAFWAISARGLRYRYLIAAVLFLVPFFTAANAVLVATPAAAMLYPGFRRFMSAPVRVAIGAAAIAILFVAPVLSGSAGTISGVQSGENGKIDAARAVWREFRSDPIELAFGLGPAETVSNAAYRTVDPVKEPESPIASLDLDPAQMPIDLDALEQFGEGEDVASSFDYGASSAIGIFGDLGVLGFAAYLAFWIWLLGQLYRRPSAESASAISGVALLLILGVVFTWWEDAAFSLYLATIAGLALTRGAMKPQPESATAGADRSLPVGDRAQTSAAQWPPANPS